MCLSELTVITDRRTNWRTDELTEKIILNLWKYSQNWIKQLELASNNFMRLMSFQKWITLYVPIYLSIYLSIKSIYDFNYVSINPSIYLHLTVVITVHLSFIAKNYYQVRIKECTSKNPKRNFTLECIGQIKRIHSTL